MAVAMEHPKQSHTGLRSDPRNMSITLRIDADTPVEVLAAVDRLVPYTLAMAQVHRETVPITLHTKTSHTPKRIELALLCLAQYTHRD